MNERRSRFSSSSSVKTASAFGSGTTNAIGGWGSVPPNRVSDPTEHFGAPALAPLASAGAATDNTTTDEKENPLH